MGEKRKKRWKTLVLLAVLVLGAVAAYLYVPMDPVKIIVSRETTFIDGPINPDGTVNYVAALDQQYAEGVTYENNAALPLLRAVGSSVLPDGTRHEMLYRLRLRAKELDKDPNFIQ